MCTVAVVRRIRYSSSPRGPPHPFLVFVFCTLSRAIQIRAGLDDVLKELRAMPPAAFTSQAWSHTSEKVKAYKAAVPLLSELRSEALKDRHWAQV